MVFWSEVLDNREAPEGILPLWQAVNRSGYKARPSLEGVVAIAASPIRFPSDGSTNLAFVLLWLLFQGFGNCVHFVRISHCF